MSDASATRPRTIDDAPKMPRSFFAKKTKRDAKLHHTVSIMLVASTVLRVFGDRFCVAIAPDVIKMNPNNKFLLIRIGLLQWGIHSGEFRKSDSLLNLIHDVDVNPPKSVESFDVTAFRQTDSTACCVSFTRM
jgi:hypothetical protein